MWKKYILETLKSLERLLMVSWVSKDTRLDTIENAIRMLEKARDCVKKE